MASMWTIAGKPTKCAFGPCGAEFKGSAFHGADGKYYCTEFCSEEAQTHETLETRHRRAS